MGAWIEISNQSLLLRSASVAPLVGAWIEIRYFVVKSLIIWVAPLVGAWIEMDKIEQFSYTD